MNQWLTFAAHFTLGGTLVATINWLMNQYGSRWAGFVYGAIPLTYIYLYVVAAYSATDDTLPTGRRNNFARASLYTVVSWIAFVATTYVVGQTCNLMTTLVIAFVVFFIVVMLQWRFADSYNVILKSFH